MAKSAAASRVAHRQNTAGGIRAPKPSGLLNSRDAPAAGLPFGILRIDGSTGRKRALVPVHGNRITAPHRGHTLSPAPGGMMGISTDLTHTLDWLFRDDPLADPSVAERSRLLLLDTAGCMIAGLARPELRTLVKTLAAQAPGTVRLPGAGAALTPPHAAYVAGMAAGWDEACEGLARAHGRPGLHAIPPVLALGLDGTVQLGRALRAVTVGYEIGGRLGEALRIRPGMHVDGMWGLFGAAASAGWLMGLDAGAIAAAIQGAACHLPYSLYLPVSAGATARISSVGHAATAGMLQAAAAAAGMTAPPDALEVLDAHIFDQDIAGQDHRPKSLAAPGEWLLPQGYLKPYAAVRHVHYGAAAAAQWHAGHGPDTSPVKGLELSVYEEALRYCANRAPGTAIQAQFSLSYGVARTLMHGDLAPDAYSPGALRDPEVMRLEALVKVGEDRPLTLENRRGATLTVRTGASEERITVDSVPGDPALPMTPGQVLAKFLRYAAPHIGQEPAQRMADALLEGPLERPLTEVLAV